MNDQEAKLKDQVRHAKKLTLAFISRRGPSSAEQINLELRTRGIDAAQASVARFTLELQLKIKRRHDHEVERFELDMGPDDE